jgi:2-polyprenyl-3-methyl-5-hydroxy-6-metoxy-1,4-benzoquinol methylase
MKRNPGQITGLASPFLESMRIDKITRYVKGGDILDFGCGNGKFSELISFDTYSGVDVNSKVIEYAKKRYSGIQNVSFYSITEFESQSKQYDCIILTAVIEHLKEPLNLLKILKNKLRGNGKIIITSPTHLGNGVLRYGAKLGLFSSSAFEEHIHIFSKQDFLTIAQELNLKICTYETFEFGLNQLVVLSNAQ